MNIEVTNLSLSLIEADLQRIFTPFGEIRSIQILRDKWNNRSRGRAMIVMPVEKEARNAIHSLDGTQLGGKPISVVGTPEVNDQPSRFTF
ncbi:MAG TPA: RNA-binding protein [Chitinophagaceae bacterium]|jgi:RNA recognition motif-containing protein|nr:RNA-binding protein [Chitinophagaceae bacterium]